jgi:hypothetical protein
LLRGRCQVLGEKRADLKVGQYTGGEIGGNGADLKIGQYTEMGNWGTEPI